MMHRYFSRSSSERSPWRHGLTSWHIFFPERPSHCLTGHPSHQFLYDFFFGNHFKLRHSASGSMIWGSPTTWVLHVLIQPVVVANLHLQPPCDVRERLSTTNTTAKSCFIFFTSSVWDWWVHVAFHEAMRFDRALLFRIKTRMQEWQNTHSFLTEKCCKNNCCHQTVKTWKGNHNVLHYVCWKQI